MYQFDKVLSPEEEMKNTYFHVDLGSTAMLYMIISTLFTTCAVYFSGLPHLPLKLMVDGRAQWMKEHYIVGKLRFKQKFPNKLFQAFENGSKIYYWPDENGVWQMEGLGVW